MDAKVKISCQENERKYLILLYFASLTLLAHGLALLNNEVYWDGAVLYGFFQENNWKQLRLLTFSMGEPVFYYIHKILWLFDYKSICNEISVISIFLMASFGYHAARLFAHVNKSTAIFIGAFIILYPGCMVTFFHATIQYYILFTLFYFAFYLGLKHEQAENTKLRCVYRVVSLALFFLSFSMKSLLVYYALFLCCAYILYVKESWVIFIQPKNAVLFVVKRLDYFSLPILFWLVSQFFFKPYGVYASYNNLHTLSLFKFLYYLFFSFEFTVLRFVWVPFVIFLIVYAIYRFVWGVKGKSMSYHIWLKPEKRVYLALFFLGSFALLLAILPYVLVDKPPIYDSLVESRFAMLVPVSLSIMLAGLIGMLFQDTSGKLGKIFITIFSVYFVFLWVNNYLRLEAEAALKKALVLHFKADKSAANYSIYWVESKGFDKSIKPAFTPYAWAWLLNEAYAGHSRIVPSNDLVSSVNYQDYKKNANTTYERNRYNVRNLNLAGCQAIIHVAPGVNWYRLRVQESSANKFKKTVLYLFNPGMYGFGPMNLGSKYLYYRFVKPTELDIFLFNLINVNITPYFTNEATDCQ